MAWGPLSYVVCLFIRIFEALDSANRPLPVICWKYHQLMSSFEDRIWLVLCSLFSDWIDRTLTSIHPIGWWLRWSSFVCHLRRERTLAVFATKFPISFIYFPGCGISVNFLYDPDFFVPSGQLSRLSLFPWFFLHVPKCWILFGSEICWVCKQLFR